jgi:hypothetical protein
MRDVAGALEFLRRQRDTGSTAWHNMCESLQRQAYGLPAHYPSANAHAAAIPAAHRYGHERPSRGDLVLYVNRTYGHIVTCEPSDAHPWSGWTNDVGGRGRVTRVNDVRDLAPWCGASSWFVADAWWSSSNNLRTHNADTEDPDMPITDEDARKIAKAVWGHDVDPGPGSYSAGGALWTALGRTSLIVSATAIADAVWTRAVRTITGGGSGSGGASAQEIADATADEIAARLEE